MRPASDVSRRINAERLLLVAWFRAILLQFAHPLIASGIAGHSTFRGSGTAALARLHQTVDAMLALTFGTDAERDAAVDAIRAIHRRVHGTLAEACGPFAAGTRYSAEDPALLTWVHATLIESIVLVYERLIAPLTMAERDRYCEDAADLAVVLGASDRDVPRSWSAIRAYIESRYASGEIVVGPQASMLAAALLSPVRQPVVRHIVTRTLSLLAAGLLPYHVRRQYRLSWSRHRARRFMRLTTALRVIRCVLPPRVTHWKRARSARRLPIRRHDWIAKRQE
jgi:uncharacterized protein (DUF2236 family)